jgi:membrane protein YqaA with SNARE-associated domain
MVWLTLFTTAALAATVLPAQSEILLAALLRSGEYPAAALVAVASLGNVLGSVVNWAVGRWCMQFSDRRWFPASPRMIERATGWYRRWGVWSLLLAWTPFLGDPLTLVAGVLRTPLPLFLLLVTIGKAGRYALLAAVIPPA